MENAVVDRRCPRHPTQWAVFHIDVCVEALRRPGDDGRKILHHIAASNFPNDSALCRVADCCGLGHCIIEQFQFTVAAPLLRVSVKTVVAKKLDTFREVSSFDHISKTRDITVRVFDENDTVQWAVDEVQIKVECSVIVLQSSDWVSAYKIRESFGVIAAVINRMWVGFSTELIA